MRAIAYVVAAIAAVGIMIAISSRPVEESSGQAVANSSSTTDVVATSMPEAGTLTLSVPEMHCPFACYPRVKETLENANSVTLVELAPQKQEGVIDNRQVIISYDAGFNLAGAISSLKKEGFTDSEVVQ